MKTYLIKSKKSLVSGFTLLEMLMVILIISVLMLLFIPNLSKQKAKVAEAGNAAVVKIVESQADIYELNQGSRPTLTQLVQNGSLNDKQVKAYQDYYAKNKKQTRQVQD
ncbi:competence type IV pilus major pilin ComGC [Streptococcus didelphis]|uniref:Competence type IV pilus major pilin ComGC n=1 Tax=Streptococcus didelphis TaxID=102886 RepID=A0ABY9LIW0_9STRE|nr:competence type IV pilus major pilin ComGC [Streptococcus didelphis]WMB28774.1 competence type IV pilus major pilin ComGC [Streptococcus didelphis]WMB29439.1 competence type IV pilus major pilin ComGC [Streptococcus didelphis]